MGRDHGLGEKTNRVLAEMRRDIPHAQWAVGIAIEGVAGRGCGKRLGVALRPGEMLDE